VPAGTSSELRARRFEERAVRVEVVAKLHPRVATGTRLALVVLLLLFVVVCGVHLTGISHDVNASVLGLADASFLVAFVIMGFLALRRIPTSRSESLVIRSEVIAVRKFPARQVTSPVGMRAPLRC
jgi:hypothetical protein